MEETSTKGLSLPVFKKKILNKFSVLVLGISFILLSLFAVNNIPVKYDVMIYSDANGYYDYLPYTFIYKDLAHINYAVRLPNGNSLNKYTMGVALLQLPFFLGAHLYSIYNDLPAKGYSFPYSVSVLISVTVYVFLGLLFLYKTLRRKFDQIPSFITVFAIFFATNLYYYTFCQPGMSHGFSFFALALFLYRLDFFMKNPKIKNTLACGIPLALAVLIRPTNILYALLFLFYDVYSFRLLKERLRFILSKYKYFLIIILIGILFYVPQIIYWSYAAGKLTLYGYVDGEGNRETFKYLANPKIFKVLFGIESGWMVYTPFFIFFFIGLFWTLFKKIHHALGILIIFLIILYLNSSWWTYSFACSFGYRSLIEYYPLFAIPIALVFSKIFVRKKAILITSIMFLLVVFSFFNIRISGFYYKQPCWEEPRWTWVNYNKIINKAFYIKSIEDVKGY